MLQNEYLVAKIGVDPAENEPSKGLYNSRWRFEARIQVLRHGGLRRPDFHAGGGRGGGRSCVGAKSGEGERLVEKRHSTFRSG